MGFFESAQSAFSHYADFSGRARRSEYWYFSLFNFLVTLAIGFIGGFITGFTGYDAPLAIASAISWLYVLAALIPSIAVSVRRMHDVGRSGWQLLLALIPLVGAIVVIVFCCQDSQPGTNQYGPNPKEAQMFYQSPQSYQSSGRYQ